MDLHSGQHPGWNFGPIFSSHLFLYVIFRIIEVEGVIPQWLIKATNTLSFAVQGKRSGELK